MERILMDSSIKNSLAYRQYLDRLTELSMSMFEWKNLPPEIDERFMELQLFKTGKVVFFRDEELDGYACLNVAYSGGFNIYQLPLRRRAYAAGNSGYHKELTNNDSVIIFNNLLRTPTLLDVSLYAEKLAEIDRTISVNAIAQKHPVLLTCDENTKLTLENVYAQYKGNVPVIMATKALSDKPIQALSTEAPYNCDKLYELKTQYWNEALTFLGISNINVVKKERMITDEVTRNEGGTIASRYSRLEARRKACRQINSMFGLDVWVDYREDYQNVKDAKDTTEGKLKPDEEGDNNE